MLQNKRLFEAAGLLYLLLPFVLFLFGWYKLWVALAGLAFLIWLFLGILGSGLSRDTGAQGRSVGGMGWTILVLAVWVGLSGIGGYAFQNHDFHVRNAIFRDLIYLPWPVLYPDSGWPPMELVYYIGFWLPAALFGKLLGEPAANFCLYLWTLLGVFLIVKLVSFRVRASTLSIALFIIFFSGMDILPMLLFQYTGIRTWDMVWPPYKHLEWWASTMQYSSFTTQLYWAFNQALPAWMCMALFLNGVKRQYSLLLWSLCLFFAPLPAMGFAPYIVVQATAPAYAEFMAGRSGHLIPRFKQFVRSVFRAGLEYLSLENLLGGGLVLALTMIYFRSNPTASTLSLRTEPLVAVLAFAFAIIEGGLFWLLLFPPHRRDLYWLAAGIMLFTFPMIRFGFEWDFPMRASIPTLFVLLIGCAEACLVKEERQRRPALALVLTPFLIIGMVTPTYEINRSVYCTSIHFVCPSYPNMPFLCQAEEWQPGQVQNGLNYPCLDERKNIGSLQADLLPSLADLGYEMPSNFLAPFSPSPLKALLSKAVPQATLSP